MATGLEVYESTMQPVRSAIQGIFANQEQLRSERETERRKLEAELRAEQRGIEAERRREAAAIRSEDRVRERRREDELETAVAEAKRLGLSTDGNLREIQGRVADYKTNVKEPKGYLLANKDVLEKVIPAAVYKQIEGNELSGEQLKQLKATYEPTVLANRQSEQAIALRKTPDYQFRLGQARGEYQELSNRLSQIKGSYIGDFARRAQNDPRLLNEIQKQGRLTTQMPEVQEVLSKYKNLGPNLINAPQLVILNQATVDGKNKLMDIASEDRRTLMEAWNAAGLQIANSAQSEVSMNIWKREIEIKEAAERRMASSDELRNIRARMDSLVRDFPDLRNYNSAAGKDGAFIPDPRSVVDQEDGGAELSDLELLEEQRQIESQAGQPQSRPPLTEQQSESVPVESLGTETPALSNELPLPTLQTMTPEQYELLQKQAEIDETIRKYTDPSNTLSRYYFADEKADEAREEKQQLIADNPFLATTPSASENTGVNVGSNIGVIPPAPLMGSDYPPGYPTMVKQVESQVGQKPPRLGSSTPQPYTPQTYMRPQFPPLPPQPLPRNKVRINQGTRALINRPVSEFGEYLKSVFGEEFPTPRYPR
jgi:tetratricopeptide (TPR) repeat protein